MHGRRPFIFSFIFILISASCQLMIGGGRLVMHGREGPSQAYPLPLSLISSLFIFIGASFQLMIVV